MTRSFALILSAVCSAAAAQTPSRPLMPDGSRDSYIGLGLTDRPRYEGATTRQTVLQPALQVEWSHGVFVSGTSLGWHLSSRPDWEWGPLAILQPGRSDTGLRRGLGSVGSTDPVRCTGGINGSPAPAPGACQQRVSAIATHLELGGFANLYLTPQLRLTTSALAGGGDRSDAWRLNLDVQRVLRPWTAQHAFSLSAGVTLANRAYHQAHFSVTATDALGRPTSPFAASGGLKDIHVELRWHYAVAPSWLIVTTVQASRLVGSAADSPAVERANGLSLSSVLAYRF
jgi:MipA family protein